ncbi:hypothetical protein KP509_29G068900 [Ceratopteris richardii]|uniref:Uncharacterized protein n=1 Tax=Ceratopteris richardii TaxID=49495 RepID=A0A8T2RA82_CERRI|nr:hypothetical protein KP509_29G068900 [Ceratopteris richardii]
MLGVLERTERMRDGGYGGKRNQPRYLKKRNQPRYLKKDSNEDFSFCKAREQEQYSFCKARQHSHADHDMLEEIMSLLVNDAENQEMSPLPEILSDGQDLMYIDASVCGQLAYLRENYMFMQP